AYSQDAYLKGNEPYSGEARTSLSLRLSLPPHKAQLRAPQPSHNTVFRQLAVPIWPHHLTTG
ncbi:hypothetical protein INR49_003700, partial [Caranx melampygus]